MEALLQQHRWTCKKFLQCFLIKDPDVSVVTHSTLFSFQAIIKDPFMLNSVILVFACKQTGHGLGLYDLKSRKWHIQGTSALKGDGIYKGLGL
ncbi:hypothetical protein C3L33_03073, partial [Rhododendron williamsianum]